MNQRDRQRDRQRGGQEHGNVASDIAQKILAIPSNTGLHQGLSAEDLVKYADQLGDFLANQVRLKTSQIRKFLDAVNRISSERRTSSEADIIESTIFLKPQLAYAAGRMREVKPLMDVLDPCIDHVKGADDFERLKKFVEAIIAYHRFHGGRES